MNWDAAATSFLAVNNHIVTRQFIWVETKDLVTLAVESFGFWTGADHRTFLVEGQSRTYYGALGQLELPAVVEEPGTLIHDYKVTMAIADTSEAVVRGQDLTNAPVEVHTGLFDPANGNLIGFARRVKGLVDSFTINRGPVNGESLISMSIKTSARYGTVTSNAKKSDQSHRERDNNDRFRKYSDAGQVSADVWGAED